MNVLMMIGVMNIQHKDPGVFEGRQRGTLPFKNFSLPSLQFFSYFTRQERITRHKTLSISRLNFLSLPLHTLLQYLATYSKIMNVPSVANKFHIVGDGNRGAGAWPHLNLRPPT